MPLIVFFPEILRLEQNGENTFFKNALGWGWCQVCGSDRVKNSQRKKIIKVCSVCFPHQSHLHPPCNLLPWGPIKPGFSTSQTSAKQHWIPQTGHNPCPPTPFSLPFWAGGLVTFFFTFPGPCCTLPALQAEDFFPRKPRRKLNFFF